MSQFIKDAKLEVTKAFPNAAANNTTDAIDLEQVCGGDLSNVAVELEIPELTALVATKTATFTFQHGDAANSLADTDPVITHVVTGAEGNGHAAETVRFRLPVACKRYIAMKCAVLTGGGDNTAKSYKLRVVA